MTELRGQKLLVAVLGRMDSVRFAERSYQKWRLRFSPAWREALDSQYSDLGPASIIDRLRAIRGVVSVSVDETLTGEEFVAESALCKTAKSV